MGFEEKVWKRCMRNYCNRFVCLLFVLTKKQSKDMECHIKVLLLLMFSNIAVEYMHSSTNLCSQVSDHSNNMGILCDTQRLVTESWKEETSVRNREAVDKHCEY
jgi:hypothetical protein